MIVGAASIRPRPAGGPGAFTFRNSSNAAEASGVDSPLPNHSVGHWGVPQPESASRSSQVRSGMSRSKLSSRNARTALRTASGVVRSADVMTGPYRTTFGLPRVVVQPLSFQTKGPAMTDTVTPETVTQESPLAAAGTGTVVSWHAE